MPLHIVTFEAPWGAMILQASEEGLRSAHWVGRSISSVNTHHPVLAEALRQLREYFASERQEFEVPLDLCGTEFQKRAWSELRRIPFGQTISYAEQAHRLGDAKKARAVGMANARNPLLLFVPCHRVIAANGGIGGFSAGVALKRLLLNFERG